MGLFDIVEDDFATDVEEYSPGVPAGIYEVMLAAVETENKADKNGGADRLYLVLTYTVTEGPQKGKSHKEWQWIVPGRATTDDEKRARSFIKTRMLQFGVPEDKINSVEVEDLVGIEGALTLVPQKNKPEYNNVQKFALFQSGPAAELPTEEPATTGRKPKAQKETAPAGNMFDD